MRSGNDSALAQLSGLFPHVPLSVVREHLDSADTLDDAAESLLSVAHMYASDERADSGEPAAPAIVDAISDDAPPPEAVDSATWTKDQAARERLFAARRQHMLAQARRRFLEEEQRRANA